MQVPEACVVDTDTLSEVMKARNQMVLAKAKNYLDHHVRFTFSIVTKYEILRGLRAKAAVAQIALFEIQCGSSVVLPLADEVVERAAEIYGQLHQRGQLLPDADILIAATALVHGLPLISGNTKHYSRIDGLEVLTWHE